VILPTGYTNEAMLEAGPPCGASAICGFGHRSRRMAAIARALIAAGEMPSRGR